MPDRLSYRFPLAIAILMGAFVSVVAVTHSRAELTEEKRAEASALFKEYAAQEGNPEAQVETVDKMVALGSEVAAILYKQIHPQWERGLREYESAFAAATSELARSRKSGEDKDAIERHRATLRRLRGQGDNLSKEALKKEGGPALEALRDLASLDTGDVLESKPELAELRSAFVAFTEARTKARDRSMLVTELIFEEEDLEKREEEAVAAMQSSENAGDAAILAENRKRASSVDPAEAEGVRDLNVMRMLLGLPPVLLDVNLNEAARGHSKDMAEKGFFAHDSPVPGKEDPWKRAKLAGTTASAENIYMGSGDPAAANRGWFFSPGHHVNMFGNHARVGMGNSGNHWTQLFGR